MREPDTQMMLPQNQGVMAPVHGEQCFSCEPFPHLGLGVEKTNVCAVTLILSGRP